MHADFVTITICAYIYIYLCQNEMISMQVWCTGTQIKHADFIVGIVLQIVSTNISDSLDGDIWIFEANEAEVEKKNKTATAEHEDNGTFADSSVLCSLWRLHSTVLKVVRPLPGCTIALHLCCGTHGIAKQNSKRAAVFARLLAMRSVCRLENPASHT